MSEICDKIGDLRSITKEVKKLVKEKVDTTENYEQIFWINFLIEIKDIDYRLYDMRNTVPKYEETE